ncbi:hypothetical protein HDV00_011736 [Rhizophlyctis rosea]|nr:hypothetical protein HDV00_011736 [Rhizophlyctis rosea]
MNVKTANLVRRGSSTSAASTPGPFDASRNALEDNYVLMNQREMPPPKGWDLPYWNGSLVHDGVDVGILTASTMEGQETRFVLPRTMELAEPSDILPDFYIPPARDHARVHLLRPASEEAWKSIEGAFVKDGLLQIRKVNLTDSDIYNLSTAFLVPSDAVHKTPQNITLPRHSLLLVAFLKTPIQPHQPEHTYFAFRKRQDLESELKRRKIDAAAALNGIPPVSELYMKRDNSGGGGGVTFCAVGELGVKDLYDLYDGSVVPDMGEVYWCRRVGLGFQFLLVRVPGREVVFGWGGCRLVEMGGGGVGGGQGHVHGHHGHGHGHGHVHALRGHGHVNGQHPIGGQAVQHPSYQGAAYQQVAGHPAAGQAPMAPQAVPEALAHPFPQMQRHR